ncbi:MAG TPA: 2-phospho-L-lactate transferase [Xanthobacteraceae bacterium]|nr:2-phospho-L-lactate transferase [Xanthobacteraceae bacterium]
MKSGQWILALAGGVGGAKLAFGLQHLLGRDLVVAVNTADDFEHLGLQISPDLDTVMYTLAGVANKAQGWGLEGETWNFMDQIGRAGGPSWFKLGDRDLATHVLRTQRLAEGATLTAVTRELCASFGVTADILPMTDGPVRTVVESGDQIIPFQEYFVRLRCEPKVDKIEFYGARFAAMNAELKTVRPDHPAAIVFCPSNPYLSIDPILSVPGFREWMKGMGVPLIAVSPIVSGMAIKGPAAKIMQELGRDVSATGVAEHYRGLVDGLVIDASDAHLREAIEQRGMKVSIENTIMKSDADRIALAEKCLVFAASLGG